jgi:hypothetical protein
VRLVVLADALLAQPVAHVLRDVHVREQGVVLEHRVDVATVRRHARDRLAREIDLALGGLLEARDHAQGRRLAAARRAEERVERPARHDEVHAVDGDDVAEALGHALDVHIGDVGLGVRRRMLAQPLRGDRRPRDRLVVVVRVVRALRRRGRGQADNPRLLAAGHRPCPAVRGWYGPRGPRVNADSDCDRANLA